MAAVLTQESHRELDKYPTIESLAIRFFPQIGCLVVLGKADNGLAPPASAGGSLRAGSADSSHWSSAGGVVPPDFEFAFESQDEVHFKSPRMHELDKVSGLGTRLYLHARPSSCRGLRSTSEISQVRLRISNRALCGSSRSSS